MTIYDVIVCGAGPAGSTAARAAAKAGLDVLLVDRTDFPRDKVCGGGLRPELLEAPEYSYIADKKKDFLEGICTSVKLYGSKPSHFIAYDSTPSEAIMYGTKRSRFDDTLFRLAQDSGCHVMTNLAVKKLEVLTEHVVVHLSDQTEVKARVVVGAGGMVDPVAKVLRMREALPSSWPAKDIGMAVAHEFEVGEKFIEEAFGPENTCHFHMKPLGIYGYAWAFPRHSSINVGYGAFLKDIKKMSLRAGFRAYLSILKKSGLFPKDIDDVVFKGARIPLRGPIKRTYSDRMLVVGDAAGFVSPISGDGITYAITSGMFAAETTIKCIEKGDCSKKALSSYESTWKGHWKKDFKVLCDLADLVEKNLDRIIEACQNDPQLVRTMVGIYNGRVRPSKVITSMKMRYLRNLMVSGLTRKGKK